MTPAAGIILTAIAIAEFARSAYDVLICFGSGLPSIDVFIAPVHSAGLYRPLALSGDAP